MSCEYGWPGVASGGFAGPGVMVGAWPYAAPANRIAATAMPARAQRGRGRRFPLRRRIELLLKRPHNRRAPARLHRKHPRPLRSDPAEALHLVERLPHADETRAAAGRVEDHVGEFAEIFEEL